MRARSCACRVGAGPRSLRAQPLVAVPEVLSAVSSPGCTGRACGFSSGGTRSACPDDEPLRARGYRGFVGPPALPEDLQPEAIADVRGVEAREPIAQPIAAVGPGVEDVAHGVPPMALLDLELDQLASGGDARSAVRDP